MYSNQYANITGNISAEIGFEFILRLFNSVGIEYKNFIIIIYLFCYLLIYLGIKPYTNNYNLIIGLYAATSLFTDFIQLRNFIAMSILIFSFQFFLSTKTSKRIMFIICMLVASTIHLTFVMYFIFVVMFFKSEKIFVRGILYSTLILTALFIIDKNMLINLLNYLSLFSDDVRIGYYLNIESSYGYLINIFLLVINVYISYLNRENMRLTNSITDAQKLKYVDVMFYVNLCMIITAPLLVQNQNFYRIFRNINILNFVAIDIVSYQFNLNSKKNFYPIRYCKYVAKIIVIYTIWFYLVILRYDYLFLTPFLKR